ncbi:helix-turn-helix domain-containing protein [Lacrimispora sp.]|uniref:helix-turn-helix domain-containing protein n=1 Tax=Lacrimispora sp. TaxID=2719234 RepID=UPI003993D6F6
MRIDRKKLVIAMMDRDMNANQLAELTGLSRATISGIRCGKSCAKDTLVRICGALKLEQEEIVE